jgi:hypothetical protein
MPDATRATTTVCADISGPSIWSALESRSRRLRQYRGGTRSYEHTGHPVVPR